MVVRNNCITKIPSNSPTSATTSGNKSEKSGTLTLDKRFSKDIKSVIPKRRQDALKWYGWGYNDSGFYVKDDVVHFEGNKKYPIESGALPLFTEWCTTNLHVKVRHTQQPQMPANFPKPTENKEFLLDLKNTGVCYSLDGADRLIRCHGQTLHDIYYLIHGPYKRIPDVVAWPQKHNDVERLVQLANKHNVVLIPFGGGTSVSGSITCPQNEQRMICILDMTQMNRMLWLNRENLTACFESGITGQDLEREVKKLGLTVGHEPDSYEFSTLGGWVATRASGMKKNVYGNIEDLVVRVRMVTSTGVLERECSAPRVSCGPDLNQIILGSEGTLGVVTEVVIKVRPLPPVRRYGSLVFPDFSYGVQFMREVALQRCQPASVRLMDHEQFILGQTLKPVKGWTSSFLDYLKKVYVTSVKCLDLNKICAVTLYFEGTAEEVQRQETLINAIAKRFKGFSGGAYNGERGYVLTFVIAYIRDFALTHNICAESFETSVPWDRCGALCQNVKRCIQINCQAKNIKYYFISCRVTQTYDAGACVYFYFSFNYDGIPNPVETFEFIESRARDEILASGGSLSHHHGVGKIRSSWFQGVASSTGTQVYIATKRQLDPKNIFAIGNLLPEEVWKQLSWDNTPTSGGTLALAPDVGQQMLPIKSKL